MIGEALACIDVPVGGLPELGLALRQGRSAALGTFGFAQSRPKLRAAQRDVGRLAGKGAALGGLGRFEDRQAVAVEALV
jgi:hypothetical protein